MIIRRQRVRNRPPLPIVILLITNFLSIRDIVLININIDFIPDLTGSRDREKLRQKPIHSTRNKDASEIIDVVNVLRANGDVPADGTGKSDDVDQNTGEVGGVGAPREPIFVIVWISLAGAVYGFNVEVAAANDVIVADHDAGDGGKEKGVSREVSGELVGGGDKFPLDDVSYFHPSGHLFFIFL